MAGARQQSEPWLTRVSSAYVQTGEEEIDGGVATLIMRAFESSFGSSSLMRPAIVLALAKLYGAAMQR